MREVKIACTGYSVSADWYQGTKKEQILLVLIGWTANRSSYQDLVSHIVDATGMSALVLEYSGHGDSPFDVMETRPAQHFLEVIYAYDWLRSKYPHAHISVMGTSYGGYLATQLTKYRTFDNLVLRVPAIYQPSDFYTLNKDIDRQWTDHVYREDADLLAKHPLLARASNFKGKTLVVVHEFDEQVPKETTDAFIKTFDAEVYLAKGFSHSVNPASPTQDIPTYQKTISKWLAHRI
jgi:hypothetical protein